MNDVDPIAEIRAWRDEFARLHGYDVKRISAAVHEYVSKMPFEIKYVSSPVDEIFTPVPQSKDFPSK